MKIGDLVYCNGICGNTLCAVAGVVDGFDATADMVRVANYSRNTITWHTWCALTISPQGYTIPTTASIVSPNPTFTIESGIRIPIEYTVPTLECPHEWKEYVGIMNRFDYCVKCDQKKGPAA